MSTDRSRRESSRNLLGRLERFRFQQIESYSLNTFDQGHSLQTRHLCWPYYLMRTSKDGHHRSRRSLSCLAWLSYTVQWVLLVPHRACFSHQTFQAMARSTSIWKRLSPCRSKLGQEGGQSLWILLTQVNTLQKLTLEIQVLLYRRSKVCTQSCHIFGRQLLISRNYLQYSRRIGNLIVRTLL